MSQLRSKVRRIAKAVLAVIGGLSLCVLVAWLATRSAAYRGWTVSMEQRIARQGDREIESRPGMLWAHRGLRGDDAPPNTAAAMRAASAAGFVGVEMDVRCRERALWVAHDEHEVGVPFAEVIGAVSPTQYVWLDFKQLSLEVARACAPALRRELPKELHARAFIESKSLPALDYLRHAIPGVRAIYTTSRWHWSRFGPGYLSLLRDVEAHDIANIGVPARELDSELAEALRGLGIFTWTTNDAAGIARQRAQGVNVILTDRFVEPSGGP